MIKIPKKILIGNTEYTIKHKHFLFDKNLGGNINYSSQRLNIKKSNNQKVKETTFFHEIAHGLIKELEYNHPKLSLFRNNEELVHEMGLVLRKTFIDLMEKQ